MTRDPLSEFRAAVVEALQREGVPFAGVTTDAPVPCLEITGLPTERDAWSAFTRLPCERYFFNCGQVIERETGFALRIRRKVPD